MLTEAASISIVSQSSLNRSTSPLLIRRGNDSHIKHRARDSLPDHAIGMFIGMIRHAIVASEPHLINMQLASRGKK